MAKNDSNTPESGAQIVSLPDGPDGVDGLTPRQRLIMDMITTTTAERGYPPSVREIADAVGLASQHESRIRFSSKIVSHYLTGSRESPAHTATFKPNNRSHLCCYLCCVS